MARTINLIREGYPLECGLDTSISHTMLIRASDGLLKESFRIHVPGRVVAFGKRDTLKAGYAEAVEATRRGGFVPTERLAGGRAAVFHEGTLAFSWVSPLANPRDGIQARFAELSTLIVAALARLGIHAGIGAIPGEYCPGEWSVHANKNIKLMGVGQRLGRNAAHIGGVVVVHNANAVNAILGPVYAALGIRWSPEATGALEDIAPDVTLTRTTVAIIAELKSRFQIIDAQLDAQTLAQARKDAPEYISPSTRRELALVGFENRA